jgi:hypothetical protein
MENFMSWSFYHIFYIDLFQALTFILQNRSFNWQIAKINSNVIVQIDIAWYIFETRFETKIFANWIKSTLLRIYFRNLSVERSVLQYKSQCLKKVNVKYVIKRSWHEIFHKTILLQCKSEYPQTTSQILLISIICKGVLLSHPCKSVSNALCERGNTQEWGIIRDYCMTFSISAHVLDRDSHIKSDREAGALIWVEGWYNRNFHLNVNVLGRFYKQFLTSLYRSTLLGIFLKPDSKQKYLQVEQRQLYRQIRIHVFSYFII